MFVFLSLFVRYLGPKYLAARNTTGTLTAEQAARLFYRLQVDDKQFKSSNLMHSVNGRTFCHLDGLAMGANENIRWHTISLGSALDVHSPSWTGNAVSFNGHRVTAMEQMPGTMRSADMVTRRPGVFRVFDHVFTHLMQVREYLVD